MAGNYYVANGKALVVDLIDGTVSAPANYYVAWGTGADAGGSASTLTTEASESRASVTESQPASDTNRFVATITCAGAGKTITEAGILTASTVGTLFLYSSFTGIALNVGDSIQFTFSLQQT
jgi:hypothetical protein